MLAAKKTIVYGVQDSFLFKMITLSNHYENVKTFQIEAVGTFEKRKLVIQIFKRCVKLM